MKITLRPSITTDGYIADKNGECYSWINPEDEDRYDLAVKTCGCEIVGRKTYEQYKEDFEGRSNVTTFVYTNQKTFKDTDAIKFVGGSPQDAINYIEMLGFKETIVSGGGELNGLLASAGLINEIHLSIHPISLGQGIKLFGSYDTKLTLKLLSVNTDVKDVVQTIYKVLN
jgi:dihydrofolate reductase